MALESFSMINTVNFLNQNHHFHNVDKNLALARIFKKELHLYATEESLSKLYISREKRIVDDPTSMLTNLKAFNVDKSRMKFSDAKIAHDETFYGSLSGPHKLHELKFIFS
jgi:hypothetical protein